MTTLREFIATRQAEIASQMAALRREDRELRIALEALDGGKPRANGKARGNRPTLSEMAITVLNEYGGTRTESIIGLVKDKYGVDVPKSSMSPQLSKLKREGVVTLDVIDKIWRLVGENESSHRNEAATDASETGAGSARSASGT